MKTVKQILHINERVHNVTDKGWHFSVLLPLFKASNSLVANHDLAGIITSQISRSCPNWGL